MFYRKEYLKQTYKSGYNSDEKYIRKPFHLLFAEDEGYGNLYGWIYLSNRSDFLIKNKGI
jgi:hypothetical protein